MSAVSYLPSAALEMGLDQNPWPVGYDEREAMNRRRTWSCCVFVDAMYSKKDVITHNHTNQVACGWYDGSAFVLPYDVHFCGITVSCL
jgi:hypothetical protein